MKFLKLGLFFLVNVVSGVYFEDSFPKEEIPESELSLEIGRHNDGDISISSGDVRRRKVKFSEGDSVGTVESAPTEPAQDQLVVSPVKFQDQGNLTEEQKALIKEIEEEDTRHHHRDAERKLDTIKSVQELREHIDKEIARFEDLVKYDPSKVTLKDRLTVLKNEADFLKFVESSDSFKDVQFSESQLEELFNVFDFPDLSDASIEQMDRHALFLVEEFFPILRNTRTLDKTLAKKIDTLLLTDEQKKAFIAYIDSRADLAKKQLESFMESDAEEEKIVDAELKEAEKSREKARFEEMSQSLVAVIKRVATGLENGENFLDSNSNLYSDVMYLKTFINGSKFYLAAQDAGKLEEAKVYKKIIRILFMDEASGKIDQQKIKKMVLHVRSFFKLQEESQQALQSGDIVALQKLQDQLRDLYEKIFQDSFSDESSEFLREEFQKMTNQILGQIKEKLSTMQGLMAPPLKGIALVKYKFQRFFTYARTALRDKRRSYVSESKINKDRNFGLETVDFSTKARAQGYVQAVSKVLSERSSEDQQQVIYNEFSALAGIRDLRGVVSPKEADKALNSGDINMNGDQFIEKMTSSNGSRPYRKLARRLLEEVTASDKDNAQKIAEKIFPYPDGLDWNAIENRLTEEEKTMIKNLFKDWIGKVNSSMRRVTIESQNPQIDLVALQLLAEYKGASLAFIRLLQTKETALYALRAFSYQEPVQMPLEGARLVFKFAEKDLELKDKLRDWRLVDSGKTVTTKESTALREPQSEEAGVV